MKLPDLSLGNWTDSAWGAGETDVKMIVVRCHVDHQAEQMCECCVSSANLNVSTIIFP